MKNEITDVNFLVQLDFGLDEFIFIFMTSTLNQQFWHARKFFGTGYAYLVRNPQ